MVAILPQENSPLAPSGVHWVNTCMYVCWGGVQTLEQEAGIVKRNIPVVLGFLYGEREGKGRGGGEKTWKVMV